MTNMEYLVKKGVPASDLAATLYNTDLGIEREDLLMLETEIKENIIATSQRYARQLDDIRRSIYIGEFVNVKYQDPEVQSKRYADRTGTICYIHKNGTYFNVKFDDTSVQESYFPSDVLEGIVKLYSEGRVNK